MHVNFVSIKNITFIRDEEFNLPKIRIFILRLSRSHALGSRLAPGTNGVG